MSIDTQALYDKDAFEMDQRLGETAPKRCPFCGGGRIHDYHIQDGRAVGCRDCGRSIHAYNPNATAEAYLKWNCRR